MSGCIGCDDSFSYERESDGTLHLNLVRDGITTRKTTTLEALNLSSDLTPLALHQALQSHFKALSKERDRTDRA